MIDGPYTLVVPEGDFKYLNNHEPERYETKYLSDLETALESHNIYFMHLNEAASDKLFLLSISRLQYSEELTEQVVISDTILETQNLYNIISCSVDSEFEVYFAGYNGNELLKSGSAFASKEEKLSNKRTLWQVIFGANKDNTVYTYTELPEDIFIDLSSKTANRTAAKVSKVLYKALK